MLGRIGIDVYKKNPLILYANIENANKPNMSDADRLAELRAGKSSAGMIGEEVYRSDDGGKTWKKVSPEKQNIGGGPGYYYMQIRIDPNDANHVYVLTVGVTHSTDGGKTWSCPSASAATTTRCGSIRPTRITSCSATTMAWASPTTAARPGTIRTSCRWRSSTRWATTRCGPTTSLADCRTTGRSEARAPSAAAAAIVFEDWQTVGGGDGFYNEFDTVTNRYLYNESQFGSLSRIDLYTGESKPITMRDPALRFNWNAPILVSPHDSNVVYHAANKLLKSTYRGEDWTEISPDLTTNDKAKMPTGKGGDGNISTAPSPRSMSRRWCRNLIWVGTDDGNVQVTKDGGKSWTKLNDKITGNPGYWVSRVIASSHAAGHRLRHVHRLSATTTSSRSSTRPPTSARRGRRSSATCPAKSVNVIREDPYNPNLLFVGHGLRAST